ncbi:MAG TPA: glycosyltransferase family A protein, partial [Acidimicrobiales bacterium]|nr:glycosyltransferase family A protein [Acidimicrobiales bacterium]
AAHRALDQHPLVLACGGHPHHLAVDRSRLGHLRLADADPAELCRRVRAAGGTLAVAPDLLATAAATAPAPGAALPVVAPPDVPPGTAGLISVVLCTRDRPEHLARCLASLSALADDHHEIIVVDNHERPTVDPTALPARARVVHEPRRGLDVARNRGLAEATGTVVAYVDDDCEVDPHWLTALRVGFADAQVQAVTGRVRPASLATPSQRWFEAHFSFDRGPHAQRFTPWDRRPWYPMWSGGIGAGCNMAFRRDELLAAGGFDEALDMGTRIGGGGDLDAFVRVLDRGSVIAYRPDALVWHHHRATERDVTRQFLGYGVAVGALLAKSVLHRPGHRLTAVRFFVDRLRIGVRLARASRSGAHGLPVRLVVVDLLGQLAGPLVYLAVGARSSAP